MKKKLVFGTFIALSLLGFGSFAIPQNHPAPSSIQVADGSPPQPCVITAQV